MLSVLLQGPGGGGGGGGGGGSHSTYHGSGAGGSCGTTCAIVIGCIFGGLGALFVLVMLLVYCAKRGITQQIHQHREKATISPDVRATDRKNLRLSSAESTSGTFTVHCSTTYRGLTANNRAWSGAEFDLHFDNDAVTRLFAGSGKDAWQSFQITGTYVLGSPTHGHIAFTKSYAAYNVQYAAEFDTSREPLVVLNGSWHTDAGTSDGGPFTLTFMQPLTIVDTGEQPVSTEAVVVDINGAAHPPQAPPLYAASGETTATYAEQPPTYVPQLYDYQHMYSSPYSGGASGTDVEMVSAPPALPPRFTQSVS